MIPPATLLIEGPAAVVETSVESHGNRAVAEAFLEFLVSDAGQQIFAKFGFRPVKSGGPQPEGAGPLPPKLFTMADLGGWPQLERELYGSKGLWTSIFTAEASATRARQVNVNGYSHTGVKPSRSRSAASGKHPVLSGDRRRCCRLRP